MQEEKTPQSVLIEIARILNGLGIDYFVSGGFAVTVWGRPRFTADIDLVIVMSNAKIKPLAEKIRQVFPESHIDETQIESALENKGEFNFIEPILGIKVDFFISRGTDFDKQRFKNAKAQDIGEKINFISPEDLIISKLLWYKESGSTRHLEDIRNIIEISRPNMNYVKRWASKLELVTLLNKITG